MQDETALHIAVSEIGGIAAVPQVDGSWLFWGWDKLRNVVELLLSRGIDVDAKSLQQVDLKLKLIALQLGAVLPLSYYVCRGTGSMACFRQM